MNELIVGESIKENYRLWRYMTLDKLINLLTSKTLFFTPLQSYQETDPFEGYMPIAGLRKLASVGRMHADQQITIAQQIRKMYEDSIHKNGRNPIFEQKLSELDKTIDGMLEYNMQTFEQLSKAMMVNCWHANNYESEAMWKLYSDDGKGVAITTNIELLKEAINPIKDEIRVSLGKVKYIDFFDPNLEIAEYIVDGDMLPLTKRLSYAHENEVRLYITPKPEKDIFTIKARSCFLPINPITLIDEVYISPYAKEPFISSTIEICKAWGVDETKIKYSDLLNSSNYLRESFGFQT